MSTSTKQGPVKLSISQISSRDLVQILLRGSGNYWNSGIPQSEQFVPESSSLSRGVPVPLGPPSNQLHPAAPWHSTGTPGRAGESDTSQAQPQHGIPAQPENPAHTQDTAELRIRTLRGKCRCKENLGVEPLVGFFSKPC